MRTVNDIQLSQKDRQSILEADRALKSDFPVSRIILFGSKARGMSEPDSDIDLLILTDCQINGELRRAKCNRFQQNQRYINGKLRRAISDRLADINLRNDVFMTSVVISEQEWANGLIRYSLFHSEIEKGGCEV